MSLQGLLFRWLSITKGYVPLFTLPLAHGFSSPYGFKMAPIIPGFTRRQNNVQCKRITSSLLNLFIREGCLCLKTAGIHLTDQNYIWPVTNKEKGSIMIG